MTRPTRNPRNKPGEHDKAKASEAGTDQLPFTLWPTVESAQIVSWFKPSFLDAVIGINNQMMHFTQHRLAEYMALPGKMSDSQSWEDVNHHYVSFFDEATSDYTNEIEKMSTMLMEASQQLVETDQTPAAGKQSR